MRRGLIEWIYVAVCVIFVIGVFLVIARLSQPDFVNQEEILQREAETRGQ